MFRSRFGIPPWPWRCNRLLPVAPLRPPGAPPRPSRPPSWRSGCGATRFSAPRPRAPPGSLRRAIGHGGPVIVAANTARSLAAGPDGIGRALAAARRGLDPQRDVLFLVLTSHGSPDGIAEKGGGRTGIVPPDALAPLLARSPVRRKVLIVSACFAGIYTGLADADTLVITAADAHPPVLRLRAEARLDLFRRRLLQPGAARTTARCRRPSPMPERSWRRARPRRASTRQTRRSPAARMCFDGLDARPLTEPPTPSIAGAEAPSLSDSAPASSDYSRRCPALGAGRAVPSSAFRCIAESLPRRAGACRDRRPITLQVQALVRLPASRP